MTRFGLGLAIAAIAVVPAVASGATTKTVRIQNIDFAPHTVVVHKGDSVTWRFLDKSTPHTVTSQGKQRFRSTPAKQSGSYTVRFNTAGTYRYVCLIHFNMKAKVVVR